VILTGPAKETLSPRAKILGLCEDKSMNWSTSIYFKTCIFVIRSINIVPISKHGHFGEIKPKGLTMVSNVFNLFFST
jgi:hypothetical protein